MRLVLFNKLRNHHNVSLRNQHKMQYLRVYNKMFSFIFLFNLSQIKKDGFIMPYLHVKIFFHLFFINFFTQIKDVLCNAIFTHTNTCFCLGSCKKWSVQARVNVTPIPIGTGSSVKDSDFFLSFLLRFARLHF